MGKFLGNFPFLKRFGVQKKQGERAETETSIQSVLERHYGGIYKRIDENRELLELLQEKAPEFLNQHSWIEGWIKSQDGFLNDLSAFVQGADLPRFKVNDGKNGLRPYPRPWPGRN